MLTRTLVVISVAACVLHPLTNSDVRISAHAPLSWEPAAPFDAMQNTDRPKRPGVKDASVKIPIERLKPDHAFEVGGNPDWIAIDDHVWVSNEPKNTVARIDPKANTVVATIAVGKEPCSGLAAGFDSLWVPNCGDPSVSRVDLKTGAVTATLPLTIGDSEGGLTTGAGSVWMMTDKKGTLARIDPATNKVKAVIAAQVPGAGGEICSGGGLIWVTMNGTPVTRIDPVRNQVVDQYGNYQKADAIRYGFGSIWVSDHGKGDLWKIDAGKLSRR